MDCRALERAAGVAGLVNSCTVAETEIVPRRRMVVESIFMRVMESRQVRTVRDALEGEKLQSY